METDNKTLTSIGNEWCEAYKGALQTCPTDFIHVLTRFASMGQSLIAEAWIGGAGTAARNAEQLINKSFGAERRTGDHRRNSGGGEK